MARKLEVEIVGDASSLHRAVGKADSSTSKLGKSFGGLGKTAALAGGAAGIGALAYGLKIGIGEYAQSAKVAAQTNAVIKSTGGVANVSAKHVDDLATSLMKKSGIDDEVIKSGANMLLTFKGIRNEAGKGNKIFDQSTKVLTDMTAALGSDPQKAAIQLGKALNDPLKGLTALTKVGVTFSEAQKETIKNLTGTGNAITDLKQVGVDLTSEQKQQIETMGDLADPYAAIKDLNLQLTDAQKKQLKTMEDGSGTMKAQKIILKELNSEFGGQAEAVGKTLPGQINIMKESFKNFAGEMVAKTIPVLQQTIAWLRDHWPEIRAKFLAMWTAVKPNLVAFGDLVATVAGLIRKHWGTIGPILMTVANIIKTVLAIIGAEIRVFTAILKGDWGGAWKAVKDIVANAFQLIQGLFKVWMQIFGAAAKKLGEAIVHGIISGLAAVPGLLKAAVTGLFHKVIDWAKDALGIASPSKVFHEIGVNMIKGMVKGIGSMGGFLKDAVVKLAKSIPAKVLGGIGGIFKDSGSGGRTLDTLIPWAHQEGMVVSSTTGGHHVKGSYHYQGRAIDVVGTPAQMSKFFLDSWAQYGSRIKELFYDPMGRYIKNGQLIAGAIGGHSDHVHLALAKGGIVRRPTMAMIGEAGPEAVIPLNRNQGMLQPIVLQLDGKTVAEVLFDPFRNVVIQKNRGGAVFG